MREELNDEKLETKNKIQEKQDEISKLQNELINAQSKFHRFSEAERIIEQQKSKIVQLEKINEEYKKLTRQQERCENKIQELEKSMKNYLEEKELITTQLFQEQTRATLAEKSLEKAKEDCVKQEAKYSTIAEQKQYWEQRAKNVEEELKNCSEELEELKITPDTGNLNSQEQEMKYKKQIEQLQEHVKLLTQERNNALMNKVNELEAQLSSTIMRKTQLEQEISSLRSKIDIMQKEEDLYKEQIEKLKVANRNALDVMNEFERVKKDRDMLLEVTSKAQAVQTQLEELKKQHSTTIEEKSILQEEKKNLIKEKLESEAIIKKYQSEKTELEKQIVRQDAKVLLIQEERKKLDNFIKELVNKPNLVIK